MLKCPKIVRVCFLFMFYVFMFFKVWTKIASWWPLPNVETDLMLLFLIWNSEGDEKYWDVQNLLAKKWFHWPFLMIPNIFWPKGVLLISVWSTFSGRKTRLLQLWKICPPFETPLPKFHSILKTDQWYVLWVKESSKCAGLQKVFWNSLVSKKLNIIQWFAMIGLEQGMF